MTFSYEEGVFFISVGATGNFGNTPANTGQATGAGDAVSFVIRHSRGVLPDKVTWSYRITGGTVSAITARLEGSLDGTTWDVLDEGTSTSGEQRTVTQTPFRYLRINIAVFTSSSGTPVCTAGLVV